MKTICGTLGPEGIIISELWKEYEAGQTPEAQIAKQLDKLQAMLQAWEYEQAGEHVSAQEFIDYDRHKITDPLIMKWLQELEIKVKTAVKKISKE